MPKVRVKKLIEIKTVCATVLFPGEFDNLVNEYLGYGFRMTRSGILRQDNHKIFYARLELWE